MKNKLLQFQIISTIIVSIVGVLLHFTYEWSNNNVIVGLFSAVNESTWEHLKLIFYPMLITTIIGYFYIGKEKSNFLCAKIIGILVSISFTVIFFYTYTGILGTNVDFLNIATFFIAVVLGEFIAYRYMLSSNPCNKKFAILTIIILILCFTIFTFFPPQIGLFEEPTSVTICFMN
mgnify:CR=1 FL=1